MDPANFLRQTYNAFVPAENAWNLNRFNPELTQQERQEYYESFMTARDNLVASMGCVRQQELLVLSSISQVRAFTSLLQYFLPDRGILQRVQLCGHMTEHNREEIRGQLESAGFVLQDTKLIFLFPPQLDFMKSKECESVVVKAAEDEWNSMSEAEKGPYERKALETSAALSRAAESYRMMMNALKETPAAAPPTEERLS